MITRKWFLTCRLWRKFTPYVFPSSWAFYEPGSMVWISHQDLNYKKFFLRFQQRENGESNCWRILCHINNLSYWFLHKRSVARIRRKERRRSEGIKEEERRGRSARKKRKRLRKEKMKFQKRYGPQGRKFQVLETLHTTIVHLMK